MKYVRTGGEDEWGDDTDGSASDGSGTSSASTTGDDEYSGGGARTEQQGKRRMAGDGDGLRGAAGDTEGAK